MYKLLNTLSEVIVDPDYPLFCDTETAGLYQTITLVQFYQADWPVAILVQNPNPFELAAFLAKYHTVWHNAHYDFTTIQQQSTTEYAPSTFDDTFLLSRLAQPEASEFSLDKVMTRVLGKNPYAEFNKSAMQKSDWSGNLTAEQMSYAATDVYYMPQVWDAVKHKTDDINYKLDIYTLRYCMQFQWTGMPVDSGRLADVWRTTEKELANVEIETNPKTGKPYNVNSWKQVREWLQVTESDKMALSRLWLAKGDKRAKAILDKRSLLKRLNFLEKYDLDYIVGKFKPSARSGRLTSDDHNMQQIPRALKEVFGYPDDTPRVLIYSDYAQLELRTICAILQVKIMEKLFREGEDLHGYVAAMLFGEDYTKADRQVTKTYNFNLLYGGSVGMVLSILITYGLLIPERQANRHKAKWLNLFPEINKWQQESISQWRKGRLASTPFGREYKGKLMTDQMNIKNQGAGAEVAKLALHYFQPWLTEYNDSHGHDVEVFTHNGQDMGLANFIHDSFIVDAPDIPEVYETIAKQLADCMQRAWFEASKMFAVKDLPMPVNVKVGKNWGDLEADKGVIYEYDLEGMATFK